MFGETNHGIDITNFHSFVVKMVNLTEKICSNVVVHAKKECNVIDRRKEEKESWFLTRRCDNVTSLGLVGWTDRQKEGREAKLVFDPKM